MENIIQERVQKTLSSANILADKLSPDLKPWDIIVKDDRFYERVALDKTIGLGESYEDGWWDCDRLEILFQKMLEADLQKKVKKSFFAEFMHILFNFQTKVLAKQSIPKHYDLGNDFFESFLDSRMVYSCGYWPEGTPNLEVAQVQKLELICKKLKLKPGQKLLDVGCGWGGLAKYAAMEFGVSVVGVTLSPAQAEYAQKACTGLPVEIRLQDYRDTSGTYDNIVSVGMFEHVGYKNYREFMRKMSSLLGDKGLFLLHTIGSKTSGVTTDPWIDKYIFPNSLLPSMAQISNSVEELFVIEDLHNFGFDYYKTLMAWYVNFYKNFHTLPKEKYDQRLFRRFNYYFLSCAGSFSSRYNQLWQIVLSKNGVQEGYSSVR